MQVRLRPVAAKYIERLGVTDKKRIKFALEDISKEPPEGDIKPLAGQAGFRLRVGSYRVLFNIDGNTIVVTNVVLRGQAYKKKNRRKK